MERVINPITKKYINVNGPKYNQLVEEGYTTSYLNSLKRVEDLHLNRITDQPIAFNDDVMKMIVYYLPLHELFVLYHTSKYFTTLLNNVDLLKTLSGNIVPTPTSFMALIHDKINNKYTYKYSMKYYKIIHDAYLRHELISSCKTRRTSKSKLCEAKDYLKQHGFAKEIDLLYASKNEHAYGQHLSHLEYAIIYHALL